MSENLSRRTFLTQTAAASAAIAASPFAVHAQDKSGSKPAIVGSGEYTYECHHGWGETPSHIKWYETHGCAVDKEGLVYITHRAGSDKPAKPGDGQDTIVVFDQKGKFVRSFGKEFHGGGHGIDIREEDEVVKSWRTFIHTHHYHYANNYFDSSLALHPRRTVESYRHWALPMTPNDMFQDGNQVPDNFKTLDELWEWHEPLIKAEEEFFKGKK